jgi:hypothetical protein
MDEEGIDVPFEVVKFVLFAVAIAIALLLMIFLAPEGISRFLNIVIGILR